jgi:hypothetical protein
MVRHLTGLAIALVTTTPLWAGELDREFVGSAPKTQVLPAGRNEAQPAESSAIPATVASARRSELDRESPTQASRGGGGHWGGGHWGGYWGGRGWGWGGRGWGWGGRYWGYGWGWGSRYWGWGRPYWAWGGWGWGYPYYGYGAYVSVPGVYVGVGYPAFGYGYGPWVW